MIKTPQLAAHYRLMNSDLPRRTHRANEHKALGRGTKIRDGQVARMKRLKEQGKSSDDIARIMGLSRSTINNHLREE